MSSLDQAEAAWPVYRDTHPANNTPEQRHAFIAGYCANGVVPEEPEWEYGFGYTPEYAALPNPPHVAPDSEAAARAAVSRDPKKWLLFRRTKAVPAGEWVPVKQEN